MTCDKCGQPVAMEVKLTDVKGEYAGRFSMCFLHAYYFCCGIVDGAEKALKVREQS